MIMLRTLTCVAFLALSATALCAQTLTIDNAAIIDVTTGRIREHAAIEIEGNRIARIRAATAVRPLTGGVIDATGLFVIPGLWDMHVHSYFGDSTTFPGGSRLILPLFIVNGVTGVRDMGSNLEAVLHARDSVAAHTLVGPRLFVSGPMLDGPHSQYRAAIRISSPDEGRAAVRMLKERGVDFIKLQSGIPRDAYFAIADEANRLGIRFEGHVPDAIRASEAVQARQASFEHLLGVFEASTRLEDSMIAGGKKGHAEYLRAYDAARERAIIRELAQHHTWQCPTLASDLNTPDDFATDPALAFWPRSIVDRWRDGWTQLLNATDTADLSVRRRFAARELELVLKMHDASIPFLAGTDAPAGFDLVPGASLHRELLWLVAAGFSPLEALQTATLNPATFLGRTSDFGTVSVGKIADLVLLSANPLTDIANTRRVVAVIADGRYYSRMDLDRLRLQLMVIAASH